MRATWKRTVAVFCAALAACGQPLQAAPSQGADHYLGQSLAVVMAAARLLSETTPLGCDEDGICLVGAPLDVAETYTLTRDFQQGRTYVLFAGGDEDALDVDLTITDGNDRQLAGDTDTERLALVWFEPPQSGTFTIRMRLHRGQAKNSFCAFVVMRANGVNVPAINLGTAGDGLMDRCRALNSLRELVGGKVGFLDREEHGAVWGAVLEADQSQSISNVPFGAKPVTILAAGDTQVRDLDLFLHDQQGNLLAQDTAPDAVPALRRQAGVDRYHTITLKNAGAGNPITFALFGVLEDR